MKNIFSSRTLDFSLINPQINNIRRHHSLKYQLCIRNPRKVSIFCSSSTNIEHSRGRVDSFRVVIGDDDGGQRGQRGARSHPQVGPCLPGAARSHQDTRAGAHSRAAPRLCLHSGAAGQRNERGGDAREVEGATAVVELGTCGHVRAHWRQAVPAARAVVWVRRAVRKRWRDAVSGRVCGLMGDRPDETRIGRSDLHTGPIQRPAG